MESEKEEVFLKKTSRPSHLDQSPSGTIPMLTFAVKYENVVFKIFPKENHLAKILTLFHKKRFAYKNILTLSLVVENI